MSEILVPKTSNCSLFQIFSFYVSHSEGLDPKITVIFHIRETLYLKLKISKKKG